MGDGMTTGRAARTESEKRGVTDVVCANYATDYRGDTVLTLYRALPYGGGRGEILNEGSYAVWHKKFERQLQDEILPLLGVDAGRIKGLRIARWGHPIPVAARGLIASGVVDQLQRPFKDRIFFVEQDNWALPAIETAIGEAHYWSEYIRRNLA